MGGPGVSWFMADKHVAVEASYPEPGCLNLQFRPPLQTWRFPHHAVEYQGREQVLAACRSAVNQDADAPSNAQRAREIEVAVEATLERFVQDGTIVLP